MKPKAIAAPKRKRARKTTERAGSRLGKEPVQPERRSTRTGRGINRSRRQAQVDGGDTSREEEKEEEGSDDCDE